MRSSRNTQKTPDILAGYAFIHEHPPKIVLVRKESEMQRVGTATKNMGTAGHQLLRYRFWGRKPGSKLQKYPVV